MSDTVVVRKHLLPGRSARLLFALLLATESLTGCTPRESARTRGNPGAVSSAAESATRPAPPPAEASAQALGPFTFADVAGAVGIEFTHRAPFTAERHVHLVMGSGLGWLDYDRDGWPDLYLCQGASFAGTEPAVANTAASLPGVSDQLYRNLAGTSFQTTTLSAAVQEQQFTMGISAADYDNDGFPDLFLTGYGMNALWHNQGDGTFTAIPIPSDQQRGRLSASCAWADIDGDGQLDLYVTNYAHLPPDRYPVCSVTAGQTTLQIACHPHQLEPLPDLLYHNLGQGEFEEISHTAGIADVATYGLGVVAADLDQDGDSDFFVANDTTANLLWENFGDLRFRDRAAEAGVATNRHGANEAGMGVALGDVDGNGQFDLFVTNFFGETNTLYRQEAPWSYADVTSELGLGGISFQRLGFGASLADWDRDGWLDLLVANGHIHDRLHEIQRDEPYAQLPLAYHNLHGARFREVAAQAGPYLRTPHVARGTAVADYDRDGLLDAAINHLNEPAALLRNTTQTSHHWLRLTLEGTNSNRGGVGAIVQVNTGRASLWRCVQAGTSYLSCDEGSLLVGCGDASEVAAVTIRWPSGRQERWPKLATNRDWHLREGTGETLTP